MGKYCVVSGCDSNTKEAYMKGKGKRTMFAFPKDAPLLELWKKKIPKDFSGYAITKKTVICEDHFQKEFLLAKAPDSHLKRLIPNAYPSIFDCLPPKVRKNRKRTTTPSKKPNPKAAVKLQVEDKCRFCFKLFKEDKIEIDELIQKLFVNLTQTQLRSSDVYSKWICKDCHHNLNFSVSFKTKLVDKQNRLYKTFEALEDTPESTGIFRVDVIENIKQEDLDIDDPMIEIKKEEYTDYNDSISDVGDDLPLVHLNNSFDQEQENSLECTKPEITADSFDFPVEQEENNDEDDFFLSFENPDEANKVRIEKKSAKEREKEPVICQHCGGIFKRKSLHNHIQIVHLKLKRFTCDICGYRSYLIREMRYHMMVHSTEKNYQCKECGKMFSTPITLSSHRSKIHKEQTEKRFLCTSCGKPFRRKCDLNDHIKYKHMESKRFVCEFHDCGKTFQNRSSFKDHLAKHTGEQNLPCEDCGKFFFTEHQLKSHKSGHVKAFECPSCDKSFSNRRLLLLHQAIHAGERRFACNFCNNRYFRKPHLIRHVTSAHMNIKLKCEIPGCTSQFARKATYKNHILSHHKDLGEDKITTLFQKIREMKIEVNPNEFCTVLS